ncbi:MAG: hypothetical protein AB1635_14565 [Acidobacteriota bacterium]
MKTLLLSLVAVVFTIVPAAAQTADVSGAWEMTFETPQGPLPASMSLKQKGTEVEGVISSPQGEIPVKGTIEGNNLAMSMDISGPNGSMTITLKAEVAGAAMKGEADYGQGTALFYGKRPQ